VRKPTHEAKSARLKDTIATAEVIFSLGQSEAQAVVRGLESKARTEFARAFCATVLALVWRRYAQVSGCTWDCRESVVAPQKRFSGLAERLGDALAVLPKPRAGFLAGQMYTALLPDDVRKALGAYYTPPPLVARLVELVTLSGFDWSRGRIIDPACGGAAFLASVAPKLVEASLQKSSQAILADIESRLVGVEVDPFAAWMSMVLLDLTLLDLTIESQRPLKALVNTRDALEISAEKSEQFDLVLGNPPYGKVTLKPNQRERFRESLFGHANLYGVFTELAVRLAKPGGLIAYVTPTSFLGGEYFKNLRKLLSKHAPLQRLDFIHDREGVFNGVLQEMMLAVFIRQNPGRNPMAEVSVVRP